MKPEISIAVGLGTATVVWSVYQTANPGLTDVRAAPANDALAASSRKAAAWTAAGLVAGISLIAKDATVFIIGGAMVVAADWWYRHANAYDPDAGTAAMPGTLGTATRGVNDPSASGMV